jgi:hypothetical protein
LCRYDKGSPIPNLYIIMEGALHRASFTNNSGGGCVAS